MFTFQYVSINERFTDPIFGNFSAKRKKMEAGNAEEEGGDIEEKVSYSVSSDL